jgi:peroxiredoxin
LLLGGGMFFFARNETRKVGDRAPDFELTDQNGLSVKLSEFRGKKNVVLAFYIKAFTPG